jgi:DNA-binding transcriptional LysR family regulator
MSRLNLDHLHAFAEVIEHGSFSAVAERMNLTQPAISQQIRQLEKRLGVRLIERLGRRATPTAAGSDLLVHCGHLETAVAALFDGMARHATGEVGRVRLGTGATACIYLLPPILRDLRQRFPLVEVTVSTGNTADMVKAVQDNRIDVGFVTLPAAGRMLDVTPVLDDEFVVIQSVEAPALPARVTAATLARRPMLLYEPGGNTRRIVDNWFARSGLDLKPDMALGSVEAIKELVGAGLGAAILPRLAMNKDSGSKSLVTRSLSPRLHRTLAVVMRLDKPRSLGLREMVAALKGLSAD